MATPDCENTKCCKLHTVILQLITKRKTHFWKLLLVKRNQVSLCCRYKNVWESVFTTNVLLADKFLQIRWKQIVTCSTLFSICVSYTFTICCPRFCVSLVMHIYKFSSCTTECKINATFNLPRLAEGKLTSHTYLNTYFYILLHLTPLNNAIKM